MKRFLITGATSGIGKEILLSLKEEFKFSSTYRDIIKKNELEKLSSNIDFFYLDLEKPDLIEETVQKLSYVYDGLIYCAGMIEMRLLKQSYYTVAKNIFNVNYFSFIELYRSLLKHNKLNDNSGSIVISSVTSSIGEKGKVLYSGSKGALEGSIRSMIKEIHNLNHRINIIKLAVVNNNTLTKDQLSLGDDFLKNIQSKQFLGLIENSDIIEVVKFLITSKSKIFNGLTINLDGGWLL
jgi:short-subunit dehydrogenase